MINLEIGKTYLTKNNKLVTICFEPWKDKFNGVFKNDDLSQHHGRWLKDGRYWNVSYRFGEFFNPELDIIKEIF